MTKNKFEKTKKNWRLKNKEYIKKERRKYYLLNKDRALELHDLRMFSGNRIKALERDNYTCQKCGKTHHQIRLDVHHKDEKGRGYKQEERNDSLNNLITWCIICHGKYHRQMQLKI